MRTMISQGTENADFLTTLRAMIVDGQTEHFPPCNALHLQYHLDPGTTQMVYTLIEWAK